MEGRKTIDPESNVLEDLKTKSVDNPVLSDIVSKIYEAIAILDRYETDRREYDDPELKTLLLELENCTSILHRDIKRLQMHRSCTVFDNFIDFLTLVFLLIGANLQTTRVVSKEQQQQLIQTSIDLQEQLKHMLNNPNFHRLYSVYVRDHLNLKEKIKEAKSHIHQGEYRLAANTLDTALRNIRGAVRES